MMMMIEVILIGPSLVALVVVDINVVVGILRANGILVSSVIIFAVLMLDFGDEIGIWVQNPMTLIQQTNGHLYRRDKQIYFLLIGGRQPI